MQPPYIPPPQYQFGPPNQKKKMSGCLLAAIIMGALLLAVVGAVVFMMFRVWNTTFTPAEQAELKQQMRESMAAGQGPTADALRDQGCFGVAIVDVEKMPVLARSLLGDAGADGTREEKVVVDCTKDVMKAAPTCEAVRARYLVAVGGVAPGKFRVIVHQDYAHESCSELYDASGKKAQ